MGVIFYTNFQKMPAVIRFGLDNMIGSLRSRKQKLWQEWKKKKKNQRPQCSCNDDLEN